MHHNFQKGFTLIEILISMVIIGIVLSFIVVSYGDFGEARRLSMSQQHFADLIKLARTNAIISAKTYGVNISKSDYSFYQFKQSEKQKTWILFSDQLFKKTNFNPHKKMIYSHPLTKQTPEIIISPDGKITPFILTIISMSNETVTLHASANGDVSLTESSHS